jgi:hypothetical protein
MLGGVILLGGVIVVGLGGVIVVGGLTYVGELMLQCKDNTYIRGSSFYALLIR